MVGKGNTKMFTHREEVEQMWNEGFSLEEIAKRFDVTVATAKSNMKVWGIDTSKSIEKEMKFATKKPFKREIFMVNGKPMLDVTPLMIDCGG